MQLPERISAIRRYLWARYLMRALLRAVMKDLNEKVSGPNEAIRTLSRQIEDLQVEVENALCDRDQIDEALDDLVRSIRHQLLVDGSEKDERYLAIIPKGIGEYTDAKVNDERRVYGLLISRMEENLAIDDPIRVAMVPKIRAALEEYEAAIKAHELAEQALDAGNGRYTRAVNAWETTVLEVHATLLARTKNRKKADRFFPKARRSATKVEAAPEESDEIEEPTEPAAEPTAEPIEPATETGPTPTPEPVAPDTK